MNPSVDENISKNGRTVAIHTHGCKLNPADTQILARQFQEAGFNTSFLIAAALAAVVAILAFTTRSNIAKQADN